jgi:hypothetical protein
MLEGINRSFTIAFTMRSGSNAISDLLSRNGLGVVGEWFQRSLASTGDETYLDSFARVVSQYQAEGVFGSKMSPPSRHPPYSSFSVGRSWYRVLGRRERLPRRTSTIASARVWNATIATFLFLATRLCL